VGIANIINNSTTTSGGEIVRELVNSSDGQGLHFADGGNIESATSEAIKFGLSDFSIEFILDQKSDNDTDNIIFTTNTVGFSYVYIFNDIDANVLSVDFVNSAGAITECDIAYDMSVDYGTPTHYVLTADRSGLATLYKNGNSVGTADISAAATIDLGSGNTNPQRIGSIANHGVLGTFYRFRTWNKLVDAKALFERADVDYADQYGRQALTDGNFPNADNWSVNDTGSGWAIGSNKATFTQTGSIYGSITQTGVFTSADVGKKVNVTFEIETATASLLIGSDSADVYTGTSYQPYTVGVHTVTFTMPSGETTIGFWAGNTSPTFSLKNVGIHVEGCVSDYDLAFANPTQSLMVQDRAANADGTASSSTAVTQVQPIIQGNLTSLAVAADGTVRIGSAAATVSANGDDLVIANTAGHAGITIRTGNTGSSTDGALYFSDGDATTAQTAGYVIYQHDNEKMLLGTADTTRLSIDSSGAVGFGVTSGQQNASSGSGGLFYNGAGSYLSMARSGDIAILVNRISDTGEVIEFRQDGSDVGNISVTASATAFNTSSDYRLKENLTPLTGALDRLDQLPVYRFNFKADPDTTVDGFVAHEVQAHVPEAITGEKDGMKNVEIPAVLDEDGNEVEAARTEEQPDYQGIDQSKLVPLLVAAVKELKTKVEALENA